MKKGQIYEAEITDYGFPNKGKAVVEDKPVWIKGALPGQKVNFRLIKNRTSGAGEGRLLEVIEPSPSEIKPDCEHFGQCGGCTYRNLPYEEQLKLKSESVKKLVSQVYRDFHFDGIVPSPQKDGYRNKMEFSFGDEYKEGPFALGLHKKASFHDIINVKGCKIICDDMNIIRSTVCDFFAGYYEKGLVSLHNKKTHKGMLRHLLVRRAVCSGKLLIGLVTTSETLPEGCLEDLKDLLLGLGLDGQIAGICHIINDSLSDVVQADRTDILYGEDHLIEKICGLEFKISVFSFFQTNSLGAEKLYERAMEYALSGIKEGEILPVIYDLYSGTGTITQLMSKVASKVIGVEIVEEAVESARINAERNHIGNAEFICGDVFKILCGETGENLPKPDMIIIDPPREGVHPKALTKIVNYGVEKLVYISCKPTSLANDLLAFKEAGYVLEKVSCVDMFPDTVHVETVVLLSKVQN